MTSQRLDTAARNFEDRKPLVERYTRLSRAYLKLSERFNQLDVEHMSLKGKIVLLLRSLENSQNWLKILELDCVGLKNELKQKEEEHKQEIRSLSQSYEEVIANLNRQLNESKALEGLLSQDAQDLLAEAEVQMELMETTFTEMEEDGSPDLSQEDKALLSYYLSTPTEFLLEQ